MYGRTTIEWIGVPRFLLVPHRLKRVGMNASEIDRGDNLPGH